VFLVLLFLLSVASLFAAASFVCFRDSEGEIEGVPCDALVLSVVCLCCCGNVLFFLVVVFSGIHCQEGGLRADIGLRTEKFCFSLVLLLLRQSPDVGFGFC
jgi:hypothetical protein